jgi:hypothetical protein
MSEAVEPVLSEDETWKAHILKARASKLSDVNYCLKHGLSAWRFTTFKKKLGLSKSRPARLAVHSGSKLPAFVKAVTEPNPLVPPPLIQTQLPSRLETGVPDPAWLAEFVRAIWGI